MPASPDSSAAPASASAAQPRNEVSTWQLVLACLSCYVLAAFAVELVFDIPQEIRSVLHVADTCLCGLFLGDFCQRFLRAERKLAFMKWGWIDLLASIPAWDALRWGRVVSVARLLLVLRAVRSARLIWVVARRDPGKSMLALIILATVFTLIGSSILILHVENVEKSNIRTGMDALWWSLTTVTTVGYGDHFPVTLRGRLVAAALMALGIALYATFTAFVSGKLLELSQKHSKQAAGPDPVLTEVRALAEEVKQLREELAARDKDRG